MKIVRDLNNLKVLKLYSKKNLNKNPEKMKNKDTIVRLLLILTIYTEIFFSRIKRGFQKYSTLLTERKG